MKAFICACLVAIQALVAVPGATAQEGRDNRLGSGVRHTLEDSDDCLCEDGCECATTDICRDKACKSRYIVIFTTVGCPPCEQQKRAIPALKAKGFKVYLATDPRSAEFHKVRAFPTTMIFDGGKLVKRFDGVVSASELEAELKKLPDETKELEVTPEEKADYQLW